MSESERPPARWKRITLIAVAVIGTSLIVAHVALERFVNRVEAIRLPAVSAEAERLHHERFVADLHADSLLFGRDLLARSVVGHVDVPRLAEGGVGLQAFFVPTVTPLGMNFDHTPAWLPDMLTLAGLIRLHRSALQTPMERALDQAETLHGFVERSDGRLRFVRSRADLEALVAARADAQDGARPIGVLLGLEGAHALEGDPANLERVFAAGYRLIGLAHFFDNAYAGSAHGVDKYGLTELGRDAVRRMEALGIAIDVAHVSPRAIEEVAALATRPIVSSHGGVKGTCPGARNLSDAEVRAIAATGGVVGIGYFQPAVCGALPADVARAIRYAVDLVGDDHVALGSDYDGATTVGFDTSHLPVVTQALLDAGLEPTSIEKILGRNVLRVLGETLPTGEQP